jgi:hypothetical protein
MVLDPPERQPELPKAELLMVVFENSYPFSRTQLLPATPLKDYLIHSNKRFTFTDTTIPVLRRLSAVAHRQSIVGAR